MNLDKYNERYEQIAPANKHKDNYSSKKQKINQKSAQRNKNKFSSKRETEAEKLRRLDVETDVPEKEEEKKPARGGIAVVNVNRRIKLLFGEEYGIHVYSKEGIGTDVIVELPLVRDGDRQGGWR